MLPHRIEEQTLGVERVEMFVNLCDSPFADPKHEDVVVPIGLTLARGRGHRHLHEDTVSLRGDRVGNDLEGSGPVVEARPRRHQLEHRRPAFVSLSHRRALGCHPAGVLREERAEG